MSISFIFIRHAQSLHNEMARRLQQQNPSCPDVRQLPEYKTHKFSQDYIDAGVSETGKQKAENIKKQEALQEIEVVIVSPLKRALDTCQILFGDRKDIKYYVQPLLTQKITSACDISKGYKINKQSHNNYQFDRLETKNPQLWQLNHGIVPQRYAAKLEKEEKSQQFRRALLQMLQSEGELETQQDLWDRVHALKSELIEYRRRFEDKKVALIGHNNMFQMLTATGSHQDGRLINAIKMNNCQIRHIPIMIQYLDKPKMNSFCGC